MSEVIPFPNKAEETGYTAFSEALRAYTDHFEQTNDPLVLAGDSAVIEQKKNDVKQVAEKISRLIEEIEGIQVELPSPTEFNGFVNNILLTPFTGQDRVAVDHYDIPTITEILNQKYQDKHTEITTKQLEQI